MKIVFLNVWGDDMRDELVDFLQDQTRDTDIFCFQEATELVRLRCEEVFSGYKEVSAHKFINILEDFAQLIYVRNDIDVLSTGTLFAQDMDRGLANYIEVKHGEDSLYVCNVHGSSQPVEKQDTSGRLKLSEQLIESFKNKDEQVVIGGDFNLEHDTESIKMFEEHGYRDLIKEFQIETTRNHLAWDRFPGNKLYYSDYIFLNKKIELKSFKIIDNEVSDHLPLLLEV